jgi:uncharacterized protein YdiU (UPF0061 family)
MKKLSEIEFRNDFVNSFTGDQSGDITPRQTPGMLYSRAAPTKVKKVELLAWSEELARQLQLDYPTPEDVEILGGNLVTPSMMSYAAGYAGHQFGNWAGQLGDGRAITLGELQTSRGDIWELQLKGPGQTPYSRRADGRAVLRSSVREYLMSEAMYYLGVPTTRALSLVSTGDNVLRDMFYDGNAEFEPGAIVMRVSPSFLRFGNFEILAARSEKDNLKKLADWTISRFFPHINDDADKILAWYKEMVERTASLMVEWMRVGFVHGVMNTDNMSILGLTIDYGPYSFVDDYDPNFTPNTTDLPGRRYAFGRQASVAKWNLGCLGGALSPLFTDTNELVKVLDGYDDFFWTRYYGMMSNKLGLDEARTEDVQLFSQLEKTLTTIKADMTIFFQLLIDLPVDYDGQKEIVDYFAESFYKELTEEESKLLVVFVTAYLQRIQKNTISREVGQEKMRKNNPRFVLRNYLLHQSIEDLQKGDDTLFVKLQQAMKEPYSKKYDEFFAKRPAWAAQKAGCSMLSCSS